MSSKWLGVTCTLAVLTIWSSFIIVARFSAARVLTSFDVAFLRFSFSGLVVLPFAIARARRGSASVGLIQGAFGAITPAQALALGATAGVGYCSLAYAGFRFAPAAHASVLMPGSLPLWTAIMSALLLGERFSTARRIGLGLIVCGDLLVGGTSLARAFQGGSVWKGDLLFLVASNTWAAYTVLCRKWRVGAVDATMGIALACVMTYVPIYAAGVALGWWPSHLADARWSEILFQSVYQGGFAMLIAGLAFTQVVATFGPIRTVMITSLVPVISALAAVPLLGEPLTPVTMMGLACVTLGLLVGLRFFENPQDEVD